MDAEGCESTFLGARRSWRLKSQGVSLFSYSKRQPHTRHQRTPIHSEPGKSNPSPGSRACQDDLKFNNFKELLHIQAIKLAEALCFCNPALLKRMSVAQIDA